MTATDYIVNLLSSAAVSAALTAALYWLLQNWVAERIKGSIKSEYDLVLEKHKAKLAAENAIATERLKADLQLVISEHQVRFARLHEKVAECVAELYLRLSDLLIAVQRYTSILETPAMGSKEVRRKAMVEAMEQFEEYYRQHRLYFPKDLADKIKSFVDRLHKSAFSFMNTVEQRDGGRTSESDAWNTIDQEVREGAKPLFEGLEEEFRNLLGVNRKSAT